MLRFLTLGQYCFVVATTLSFDGEQFMKITMPEESRTEAEDISIRFQTKKRDGLIFATTSGLTVDRMELSIDDAKIKLDINLGSGSKVGLCFSSN